MSHINLQIQATDYDHTIGLLDIYGFEVFERNSLEQLCINYANEKLQQHYVKHFLKDLQREYESERISWQFLDYTDNQPCLDVIEGQPSVFGLLNEVSFISVLIDVLREDLTCPTEPLLKMKSYVIERQTSAIGLLNEVSITYKLQFPVFLKFDHCGYKMKITPMIG